MLMSGLVSNSGSNILPGFFTLVNYDEKDTVLISLLVIKGTSAHSNPIKMALKENGQCNWGATEIFH